MRQIHWTIGLGVALSLTTACGDDEGGSGTGGTGGAASSTSAATTSTGDATASTGDGPSTVGGSVGGGGSGGAPSTSCDEGFTCVPAHPDASRYFSVDATSCPGLSFEDYFDTCDESACACDAAGPCDVDVFLASDSACTDFVGSAEDGCTDVPDGDVYFYTLVGGDCQDTPLPKTLIEGCEVYEDEAQPCEEGVCVPEAPDGQYCIAVGLDFDCPDEVYTQRIDTFSGGDDTCMCICGGDGACDDPVALVSTEDDACGETETLTLGFGDCERVQDVQSIEVGTVPSSSETCTAAGTYVGGGVSTTALCCMP